MRFSFRKPENVKTEYRKITMQNGKILKIMIVSPLKKSSRKSPGVLWIHGGGYVTGTPELVYSSRGLDLVTKCGAVVISPAYSLSATSPYPDALYECHQALIYIRQHASELGIRSDQIIVGGESAGGGLTAALCMYAKDHNSVNIAFQLPLYPMLDCYDTPTSWNNHEKVWNTHKNHLAWKLYLRRLDGMKKISCYASPSRRKNYEGLPPCYTFIGDKEPFYYETLKYISDLRKAGVEAYVSVWKNCAHAFDMTEPERKESVEAADRFIKYFKAACRRYRAPQEGNK